MSWGKGVVLSRTDASAGGAFCDACDRSFESGLVLDVSLRPFDGEGGSDATAVALCEACFEDLTSDMGIEPIVGSDFLILVEPWFVDRR